MRAAKERQRPNEARLRELRESALPSVQQHVPSPAPIHRELEQLGMAFSLGKLRELLGADDPFVRKVRGRESPEDLARARRRHAAHGHGRAAAAVGGGQAAVAASEDPLIRFARAVDAEARELRRRYEDEVEAKEKRSGEIIGQARFALLGTSTCPDATGTLRLGQGAVRGWDEAGRPVPPLTRIGGAFERDTGKEPFALPQSWLRARGQLELGTPLNLSCTVDSTGGNSGSPLVNRAGEVVGLIFDGNIHSLGGSYWYDKTRNRAVAVHSAGLLEVLRKVYRADRLVREIRPGG